MAFLSRGSNSPNLWPHLQQLIPSRRFQDEFSPSAGLDVLFVNSAAEIPSELDPAGFPSPLEGPWIYEVLERSGLEDQLTLIYAVVFQKAVPVAAAPAFVTDVPMEHACPEKLKKTLMAIGRIVPSILYQRTLFVGYPGSPEGVIGIVPGANRAAVLLALQEAFEKKANECNAELIIWRSMPKGISHDLERLTGRGRLFGVKSLPSTILKFKSEAKEDYFAQLTAAHRWAFKRNLKRSFKAVSVSVEVLQQPASQVLDEAVALFQQTALRAKMKSNEVGPGWFREIAALPEAYFMIMRETGTSEMIAATAYFDRKPMLVARHVGFDYSKPLSWMLYYRLWDALVDWALANGFTSIYSGPTSYAAKLQTGHELIPLFNYLWHRNPLMNVIYRAIAQRLDWAALDEDLAKYLKAHPDAWARAEAPRTVVMAGRDPAI